MTKLTKSQIMAQVQAGFATEIFSHTELGHFDVTAMRARAKAQQLEPVLFKLEPELLAHITADRDVDEHRVWELSETDWQHDPALCILYTAKDGREEHLLIDGTHRILRRLCEHQRDFLCWCIPVAEALRPDFTGKTFGPQWGSFQMDMDCQIFDDQRQPKT